jgi:hypothetical protein
MFIESYVRTIGARNPGKLSPKQKNKKGHAERIFSMISLGI